MQDDGPSLEDLNRFSGDTAYCPECGEEIWDQAEFCPACRAHLGGHTASSHPEIGRFQARFFIITAIIVLLAFLLMVIL